MTTPDGDPVVAIAVCYCGPLEEGEKVLKPLKAFGSPVADLIRPMAYVEVQQMFDAAFPPGRRYYWKSSLIRELDDAAIEVTEAYGAKKPTPMSAVAIQQLHGAVTRVGASNTAFAHRYYHYNFIPVSVWLDPSDSDRNVRWAREIWEAMQPFFGQDVYVNDIGEEGEDRVRGAYGSNYERLLALKNKYDPTNLFHLNQNIRPTV